MRAVICPVKIYANNCPDQTAVISRGHATTYRQLNIHAERVFFYLHENGIRTGDRVAILSYNCLEYIIALIALWRIGATACPLNIQLPPQTIQAQLSELSCRTVLVIHHFREILRGMPFKLIEIDYFTNLESANPPQNSSTIFMEQEVSIIYTSGSTGKPKPAVHTLSNHYYSSIGANENIPFKYPDRWLVCLPFYHVSGLSILFRCFYGGGSIVLPSPKENMLVTIPHFFVTHVSLVPAQLIRLLKDPKSAPILHQLKFILLGGAPVPESVYSSAIQNQIPIYPTYGLTEMSSQVATSPVYKTPCKEIPKPRVLDHREIRICPDGEIQVRGDVLFRGYLVQGGVDLPLTEDGWFQTGDIGGLNAEGELNVFGRKDNMFISGGENIQPEEIERYLLDFPQIDRAVIVSVTDERFGRRPVAFIHYEKHQALSIYKIEADLLKKLPRYKIPVKFYAWPAEFLHRPLKPSRQDFQQLADHSSGLIPLE